MLWSDISVEVLQQLSEARPPGVYFLSASLQQLAEMSCLGREADALLLVSSPSNPPTSRPPPLPVTIPTRTSPPRSVTPDSPSNIFHILFHLPLIGNLESLCGSFCLDLFLFFPFPFPLFLLSAQPLLSLCLAITSI